MTVIERPIPRATYRLQLNKDFTFRDVEAIALYLGQLGISHAYLSPILEARPGSTHGYDTVNHRRLNPELGTLDEFRQMAAALRTAGVSIILDIVPNHMGIGGDQNDLWLDVLEWGKASRYADWFDIDWAPSEPTLEGKVLVPFLGTSYGEALRTGRLDLRFDAATGSFSVWAEGAHRLPVCPASYGSILQSVDRAFLPPGDSVATPTDPAAGAALKASLVDACAARPDLLAAIDAAVARINTAPNRAALAQLIEQQNWRPARYSVAADDINYRRFFVVSDLAAIRIEREEVFDRVHALTFQLVAEGLVDGLRVDHIDGLRDPHAYCLELRRKCPKPIYLVVEKILAEDEQLPLGWDVEGTTGYEFAAAVNRLLTDPASEVPLSETYARYTGRTESLSEIERSAKLDIMDFEMAAELDGLADRLRRLAVSERETADLTRNGLRAALRATIAQMEVYRTYVAPGAVSPADRQWIASAIERARKATPALGDATFAFLQQVMTASAGPALEVAMGIQQYSGPVMAKGLEDTALYRFNRLIALSDVGAKPDRFTQSVASMHRVMRKRLAEQPHGLLCTSSHDTKRGEDTRARIAALSGHADAWAAHVDEWRDQLGAYPIEPNDSYYFFQLLLGAWPAAFPSGGPLAAAQLGALRERIAGAMLKSVREARLRTNWIVPQEEYEAQVRAHVEAALSERDDNAFLVSFRAFERSVATDGAQNGLIETVLKLTTPGVPDVYQGAELWEQSTVDPDNRRSVDYALRRDMLARVGDPGRADDIPSGMSKLALIARLLAFRAHHPALFAKGGYEPVEVSGPDADRVFAFRRHCEGEPTLLVAVALWPWRGAVEAQLEGIDATTGWVDVLSGRPVADPESIMASGKNFIVLATT